MGTETKVNCYKEKTSSNGVTTKSTTIKGSTTVSVPDLSGRGIYTTGCNDLLKLQQHEEKQQQSAGEAVVPYVRVYIDEHNVIDGAKKILEQIRPQWDLNQVQFKKFTDGITNKLVGCFYDPTTLTNGDRKTSESLTNEQEQENEQKTHDSKVVLVRVYGNKTDLLIDRNAETRNIMLLHKFGLAPPLYATFKNGLAYDYVPGVTLNPEIVLRPEVWSLVAKRLAELHLIQTPKSSDADVDEPSVPMLWSKIQKFFDLVPERFSNAETHSRIEPHFLPISRMREEFDALYSRLKSLNSPLVFAHNDLLLGNVIYTESQQKVSFIDYEYADYNHQAFDIGNHFAEFAGVDEVDYSRYPSREFQLEWLKVYLCAYKQVAEVSEQEIERLYVQVNQFSLAAHFFWTIWSLLQAEYSTNKFDYAEYALIRYNEYLTRKEEFLDLNLENSS